MTGSRGATDSTEGTVSIGGATSVGAISRTGPASLTGEYAFREGPETDFDRPLAALTFFAGTSDYTSALLLYLSSRKSSQYPHPQASSLPQHCYCRVWQSSDDQQKWTLESSHVLFPFHEVDLLRLVPSLSRELVQ
jgi:hypothetical protein